MRDWITWSVLVAGFQLSALITEKLILFRPALFHHCWDDSLCFNVIFDGLNGCSAGKLISILRAPLSCGGMSGTISPCPVSKLASSTRMLLRFFILHLQSFSSSYIGLPLAGHHLGSGAAAFPSLRVFIAKRTHLRKVCPAS